MKQYLYAHRLEEGASVHEHLIVFKEILSNLEAMEVQYDKEDLGLILLCSLPLPYSTFRDTILYSRESLTVDEERNHRGKSKGRSKSSNRGKTYNFYKKKGHIKSECYKLQDKIKREAVNQKGKQQKNSSEADVVEDYNDGELLVPSVNNSKGSTVIGDAAVASSSLLDDDTTKLWRMRLGHMSENSMAELSKRGLLDGQEICKLKFCEHYIFRKSPSVAIEKNTPQKVWSGNPADYSDLKIFGCPAKVMISRDVVFDETAMLPNLSLKYSSNKENQKQVEHQINPESKIESTPQATEDIDANHSEAFSCKDSEKWMFAMKEEVKSLYKNRTWDLVKLPKGKKVVRCKWVFKKKEGTLGVEEPKYKARLVAKGYSQIPRVDFTDVFSPVVKHSSIRVSLGIVAVDNLELEQLDSLYGLKQSLRQWYKRFDSFMTSHDLKRSSFDICVYFKKNSNGSFVYLLLCVDDMLIATKDKGEIIKVKAQLSEEFEMKDLGPAKKILGMEILRERKVSKLYLIQKGYIEKVLYRFNIQRAKPCSGISHVRFVHVQIYHMHSVQLADTWQIPFGRTRDGVIGYVDVDFARDLDRRRSLTGYVFTIGGCAISWKATLQTTVTLPTTEAEYMAITEACKGAIWLKGLFSELNEDLQISIVSCDS
ncbi:hypothetical protein CXB51_031652 [Gossypium anomalum]|uniref:Reverse transcriptase Ty1/copia-type domain-containing protein n=1 Tax=Gossypium anomalum TaxID=47600 RepID=A0A8J6CLS6_9ROSI|nr:hypothetical protein CXB51_031652 [Gossypium anomalum]